MSALEYCHCICVLRSSLYIVIVFSYNWTPARPMSTTIFIAREHAVHTERDIVLPIPSVCTMPVQTDASDSSSRLDYVRVISTPIIIIIIISSHFFDILVDASLYLSEPSCRYKILMGTLLAGPWNTRGWEEFTLFEKICRLSRKRYEIGPWLLWITNTNTKSQITDRSLSVPVTLQRITVFTRLYRLTTFGKVPHMGRAYFYGVRHAPSWGGGPIVIPFDLDWPN